MLCKNVRFYWDIRCSSNTVVIFSLVGSISKYNCKLLTGCQVLPWNKPIQLYPKTGLEISVDFGPENMWQYVANLDKDALDIQIMSCDKLHHHVIQHFCRAT